MCIRDRAQSPAYLIALILRMYPKLVIQDNPKDEISQMQMAQQATEILLEGLRTVSYTHLDVYKRQG